MPSEPVEDHGVDRADPPGDGAKNCAGFLDTFRFEGSGAARLPLARHEWCRAWARAEPARRPRHRPPWSEFHTCNIAGLQGLSPVDYDFAAPCRGASHARPGSLVRRAYRAPVAHRGGRAPGTGRRFRGTWGSRGSVRFRHAGFEASAVPGFRGRDEGMAQSFDTPSAAKRPFDPGVAQEHAGADIQEIRAGRGISSPRRIGGWLRGRRLAGWSVARWFSDSRLAP